MLERKSLQYGVSEGLKVTWLSIEIWNKKQTFIKIMLITDILHKPSWPEVVWTDAAILERCRYSWCCPETRGWTSWAYPRISGYQTHLWQIWHNLDLFFVPTFCHNHLKGHLMSQLNLYSNNQCLMFTCIGKKQTNKQNRLNISD